MTRTQHFLMVVLFLTSFLLTVYALKAAGLIDSARGPTYEGFAELSKGAIAGIVIAVFAGVGLLYYLYKRFRGGSAAAAPINNGSGYRPVNNGRGYNNRGAAY